MAKIRKSQKDENTTSILSLKPSELLQNELFNHNSSLSYPLGNDLINSQLIQEKCSIEHLTKKGLNLVYASTALNETEQLAKLMAWKNEENKIFSGNKHYVNKSFHNIVLPYTDFISSRINKFMMDCSHFKFLDSVKADLVNYEADLFYDLLCQIIISRVAQNINNYTYEEFINHYLSSKQRIYHFLSKHLALRRQLTELTKSEVNRIQELILSLDNSVDPIISKSGSNTVKNIKFGISDSHSFQKKVLLIEFENSEKLVYKPLYQKNMTHFDDLYRVLSCNLPRFEIPFPTRIDTRFGCFEEFVSREECDEDKLLDYYFRYGALIAAAFILSMTDLHFENIIPHKACPVPIDTEAFLNLPIKLRDTSKIKSDSLKDLLGLVNTGLLSHSPIKLSGASSPEILKFNALEENENVYETVWYIQNDDSLKIGLKHMEVAIKSNQSLPSKKFLNKESKHKIIDGFVDFLTLVTINKTSITKSINKKMNNCTIRVITKNTSKYAEMLSFLKHPNYSVRMLDRYRLLDNLYAFSYEDKRIVPFEIESLARLDIPIFFANADNRDLISDSGERIGEWLPEQPKMAFVSRIRRLNIENIQSLTNFLKLSLGLISLSDCKTYVDSFHSLVSVNWSEQMILSDENYFEFGEKKLDIYSGEVGNLFSKLSNTEFLSDTVKNIEMGLAEQIEMEDNGIITGKAAFLPLLVKLRKKGITALDTQTKRLISELMNNLPERIDWIGGLSSILSVLCDWNTVVNKQTMLHSVKIVLKRILTSDFLNINNLTFAHGLSGVAYSLKKALYLLDAKKDTGLINLTKATLDFIREKNLKLFELEQSQISMSWCNGVTGILMQDLLPPYTIKTELKEYLTNFYAVPVEVSFSTDTLCHGTAGFIISLQSLYRTPTSAFFKDAVIEDMFKFNKSKFIEKSQYCLVGFQYICPVGLFDGLTGINYTRDTILKNNLQNALLFQ